MGLEPPAQRGKLLPEQRLEVASQPAHVGAQLRPDLVHLAHELHVHAKVQVFHGFADDRDARIELLLVRRRLEPGAKFAQARRSAAAQLDVGQRVLESAEGVFERLPSDVLFERRGRGRRYVLGDLGHESERGGHVVGKLALRLELFVDADEEREHGPRAGHGVGHAVRDAERGREEVGEARVVRKGLGGVEGVVGRAEGALKACPGVADFFRSLRRGSPCSFLRRTCRITRRRRRRCRWARRARVDEHQCLSIRE